MNTMSKQGIDYQQIMSGGIDVVYKVAAANQQDLEETANVVSDIYNEMGDLFKKTGMSAQESAQMIGNSMTVALHHARISMTDFMNTMKYVGPQASAMGVGIKDVSAAIALLGQHGIRGSQAGTTLRRMLTNLTPTTKQATAEMEKLGMITKNGSNIFYDASGKMKPLAEVQQLLHDKLSGLNPQMQQLAIKTIFGQYALSGMTAIVDTAPEKFQGLTQAMDNNNIMTDIMNEKSQGLGMQLEKLNAHWETVKKTIGEALKPVVEVILGVLDKLMKMWEGLNPHVQQAIIIFGAVTGVILLVGGALLAIIGTIGMFATAFEAGLVVLSAIAAPIGIAIAVIAALVAVISGLAYAWNHNLGGIQQKTKVVWAWVTSQFNQAMAVIKHVVGDGIKAVMKWWHQMEPTFSQAVHNIYAAIIWLKPLWEAIWNTIKFAVSVAFGTIVREVQAAWGILSGIFQLIGHVLTGQWGKAWNDIKQIVTNAIKFITAPFNSLFQQLSKIAKNIFNSLKKEFNNGVLHIKFLWQKGINNIKRLWEDIVFWIVGASKDFADAIVNAFEWMYNHNYFFKNLVDFIRNAWDTISKDAQAIWNTIKSWLSSAWNSVVSTLHSVFSPIAQYFSGIWNSVSSATSKAWNSIVSAVTGGSNKAVSSAKGIFNGLGSFFTGLWVQAEQWGSNLINMVAKGISNAASAVTNAVKGVAGNIASFLGFHSPTPDGPASDSDTWMPNMIKMFTKGIQDHAPQLQMAIGNVALGLKTGITSVNQHVQQNTLSIPPNRAQQAGQTIININIDGRSHKTDSDLAETIARKLYTQMHVVS